MLYIVYTERVYILSLFIIIYVQIFHIVYMYSPFIKIYLNTLLKDLKFKLDLICVFFIYL